MGLFIVASVRLLFIRPAEKAPAYEYTISGRFCIVFRQNQSANSGVER